MSADPAFFSSFSSFSALPLPFGPLLSCGYLNRYCADR